MSPTQLQPLPPGPHNSARLTLRSAGPVNGRLAAKMPHRVAHLGRVHLAAPQHCQQLLGVVGVLAGAGGPVALQTKLWWARARGYRRSPGLGPCLCVPGHLAWGQHHPQLLSAASAKRRQAFCSLKPELQPAPGLGCTQDPLSAPWPGEPGRMGLLTLDVFTSSCRVSRSRGSIGQRKQAGCSKGR